MKIIEYKQSAVTRQKYLLGSVLYLADKILCTHTQSHLSTNEFWVLFNVCHGSDWNAPICDRTPKMSAETYLHKHEHTHFQLHIYLDIFNTLRKLFLSRGSRPVPSVNRALGFFSASGGTPKVTSR